LAARGAVVITGTSSGIGRACALRLDGAGFDVFACVRKPDDGKRLRDHASERLRPLIVDVTDEESIAAAAGTVRRAVGDSGVAGLVNNAGMTVAGPLEFLPLDELRQQLEVNLIGQVAATQAFLPLIRKARGRIVNVSSVGGRVAHGFLGPYHASKFAIEAVTDSLRKELRPWGIHVIAIEPGSIATPIWEKGEDSAAEMLDRMPPEGRELYGEAIPKVAETARKTGERAIPADRVAKVVERALTGRRPRTRYLVGIDARAQVALDGLLPDRAMDALEARFMGL
jgi:NAD(P)-dependent dehydrogenase (short-subunit alcohol dehydrogenase family)